MNIHDYSGELNRINTYMYQLASSHADKTYLCKQISILQEAINRKDAAVDSQMVLIDAEFEKIALATNSSIVADRIKYAKEVANANIASDAKAAADAKVAADAKFHFNHEDKMVRSLYRFHIYFTIRRILSEMKCTLLHNAM